MTIPGRSPRARTRSTAAGQRTVSHPRPTCSRSVTLAAFWYVNVRDCGCALAGSSVAFVGPLEESPQLALGGGLLLLHQLSMAFGDAPAVGLRHGGAIGTAGCRLQLLPVVTTGPAERKVMFLNNLGSILRESMEEKKEISYLALTQGFVCISRPLPQLPCFSEPAGR